MEFLLPNGLNTVTLNEFIFPLIYNSTNDKDAFLRHFQNCMKNLNISYYNSTIHQNVNTMIQIILEERNFYMKENTKLNELSAEKANIIQHEKKIAELKTQLSRNNSKMQLLESENDKLQNQIFSLLNQVSTLQKNCITENKKTEDIQELLNSTVAQYQKLFNKNKMLETENRKLQECQKILDSKVANIQKQNKCLEEENTVLKQRMKSIKEYEEMIGFKNDEIEKLQNQIQELLKENEKIIIDFGERELIEQKKKIELEKKLKDYEIKRNYYISEAEKLSQKLYEKENEQSRIEISRKRPRPTMYTFNEWNTNLTPPFQQHSELNEQPLQQHHQQHQNSQTNVPLTSPFNLLSCNSIPEFRNETESTSSKWNKKQPKIDEKKRKGYILFATERRKIIMTENSDAGFAEISKMIGIQWNKLSNEQKSEYQFRAESIQQERINYLTQSCKK